MTQAIFGLLGVVVGSVITWGIELWRARRRDSDEGRVAARLVMDELHSLYNQRTANEPEAPRQIKLAREQDAWLTHRAVLARELTHESWRAVRLAYDALSTGQETMAGEKYVDSQVDRATAALKPLASEPRYWWQRARERMTSGTSA